MAIALTATKSSTSEPYKKNRWIFQFSDVKGTTDASSESSLAFAAHTVTPPKHTLNTIEHNRLNEKFWTAGKPTWNDINATFYDYHEVNSAGDILYSWSQAIYEPLTGAMGVKSSYTTSATLAQLGPGGNVTRIWNIFYIWPFDVTYGDTLSYDDDGISEVTAIFKYDYAIKSSDTDIA